MSSPLEAFRLLFQFGRFYVLLPGNFARQKMREPSLFRNYLVPVSETNSRNFEKCELGNKFCCYEYKLRIQGMRGDVKVLVAEYVNIEVTG